MRRLGTTPDVNRIAAALGVNQKFWSSLAAVEKIVVDPAEGVFADVTLMPSGDPQRARMPAGYAGSGYGTYGPIEVGAEVLVEAPSGEPSHGLVIVGVFWSPSDLPPPEAVSHSEDYVTRVRDGRNLRLVASGAGMIALNAPKVQLGAENAAEQYLLGTTYRAAEATLNGDLQTQWGLLATALAAAGSALQASGVDPGFVGLAPVAAAAVVTAGIALGGLPGVTPASAAPIALAIEGFIAAFESSAGDYLSDTIRGIK